MRGAFLSALLRQSNFAERLIATNLCRNCFLTRCRLLQQGMEVTQFAQLSYGQRRWSNSDSASSSTGGLFEKIKFDFGFVTGLKYKKSVLNLSGFRMFVCCTEMIDYQEFFKELKMPDTFNSWFLVTSLHIWLCMTRLSMHGKDGRVLRNFLVKAMWEDVDTRSKQLGEAASLTARKQGIQEMSSLFYALLFAYDEGLLGDDKELAGALWRILFGMDPDVDPSHLELMVSYVRKQVAFIDGQDEDTILGRGIVTFLPLRGDQVDAAVAQRQALTVGRLRTKA